MKQNDTTSKLPSFSPPRLWQFLCVTSSLGSHGLITKKKGGMVRRMNETRLIHLLPVLFADGSTYTPYTTYV